MLKLVYDNINRVLQSGPCRLYSVLLSGDGAAADLQLYDSTGSSSDQKLHLESGSGVSFLWSSSKGIKLNNGIYIVVNAVTSKYSIEFDTLVS